MFKLRMLAFVLVTTLGHSAHAASRLGSYTCALGMSSQEERSLREEIDRAISLSRQSIGARHAILWPLVEVLAAVRSSGSAIKAGASLFIPFVGPLISAHHSLKAIQQSVDTKVEAVRTISRDAGLLRLNFIAHTIGQRYRGQVPSSVMRLFAEAFDQMAQDLPGGWERGRAFEYLSTSGRVRPDGLELHRWNLHQFESAMENELQFLVNEINHARYTLEKFSLHLALHRLAGLRALLQARPLDAIILQNIGDLDRFEDDYH